MARAHAAHVPVRIGLAVGLRIFTTSAFTASAEQPCLSAGSLLLGVHGNGGDAGHATPRAIAWRL